MSKFWKPYLTNALCVVDFFNYKKCYCNHAPGLHTSYYAYLFCMSRYIFRYIFRVTFLTRGSGHNCLTWRCMLHNIIEITASISHLSKHYRKKSRSLYMNHTVKCNSKMSIMLNEHIYKMCLGKVLCSIALRVKCMYTLGFKGHYITQMYYTSLSSELP